MSVNGAPIEYVVVRPQIVGSMTHGFETVYYSDLVRKPTRDAAIRHGIKSEDHDDFLLAHLKGNALVGISWQYDDRDLSDPDERDQYERMADTFGWNQVRPS